MSNLRISGVVAESITDGPGIRAAIFLQGCPHNCAGCHNPDSHDFAGGSEISTDRLFEDIKRNPLLSGVTFSGGEPMCQAAALAGLARQIKSLGLEVAVYTGYTYEELISENDPSRMELLGNSDILVDGRFVLAERSLELKFKGSRNQRIINLPESLETGGIVLETSERWT